MSRAGLGLLGLALLGPSLAAAGPPSPPPPVSSAPGPRCAPLVRAQGEADVDWAQRLVRVTGVARPRELSAHTVVIDGDRTARARQDAIQRLRRALAELPLDGGRTLGAAAADNPALTAAIEAALAAARFGPRRTLSDGLVLWPAELALEPLVRQLEQPGPDAPGVEPGGPLGGPTGLLIDARSLQPGLRPALLPPVRAALDGRRLVLPWGGARYCIDDRAAAAWVGPRPLVLRATGVGGASPVEPLLDEAAAQAVRAAFPAGRARVWVLLPAVAEESH